MSFRTAGKAIVEGEESPNYFAVRQQNPMSTISSPIRYGIPHATRQSNAWIRNDIHFLAFRVDIMLQK